MKLRVLALCGAALLIPAAAHAQFVFKGGSGGGGSGTVTSITQGNGISVLAASPCTTTCTIATTVTNNNQTGTSYAILSTDGGKVITGSNGSAIGYTLSQANQTGFTSGFGSTVANINAAGGQNITITATTSTFGNGATTLVVRPGQVADFASNSTNYPFTALSLPLMAADTLIGNFSGTSNYGFPSAALSDCDGATNALTYDTTTHAFGCNTIAGGGSGTVNSGTAPGVAYYAANGTAVSDGGAASVNAGALNVTGGVSAANGLVLFTTNTPCIYSNSTCRFQVSGSLLTTNLPMVSSNTSGPQWVNSAASATVPTLVPNRSSSTTGWGAQASGNLSGIIAGTEKARIDANGMHMESGWLGLKVSTVAALPGSPVAGAMAAVSDAAACTYQLTPVVGSGSTFCPVIYNGSAWQAL